MIHFGMLCQALKNEQNPHSLEAVARVRNQHGCTIYKGNTQRNILHLNQGYLPLLSSILHLLTSATVAA
jgi:hypothetical protein